MPNSPLPIVNDSGARRAFAMHDRTWQENRYVYPVVSRRSKGISIGVNLNPDKVCNFDCIYCSVDRTIPLPPWGVRDVDVGAMREELERMLELVRSGEIYQFDPFDRIPAVLRRVNDVAFSGDGEPTTCPQFPEAVRAAAEVVEHKSVQPAGNNGEPTDPIKLLLITNATMFHKPAVRETLAFMDAHHGEIWAKLDAGTQEYYQQVDRAGVSLQRVLENILACARARPTVIQTLLMRVHGAAPPADEIGAYGERLREISQGGGRIKLVQLYTVARRTTESYAAALLPEELQQIADRVRQLAPGIPVEVYP